MEENSKKIDIGIKKSILYPTINFIFLFFPCFFGKNANPKFLKCTFVSEKGPFQLGAFNAPPKKVPIIPIFSQNSSRLDVSREIGCWQPDLFFFANGIENCQSWTKKS